jgi:mannan endo-1,4-beta-mannosidase
LARWRGKRASQFYYDSQLIQDFKDILKYMLMRKNTITGILYKDDPTVLAWQLGNELGGWGGPSPPASWTIEMASFIKSIAPNNLVMDGSFGALDAKANNRYTLGALGHPSVDIFSNHY